MMMSSLMVVLHLAALITDHLQRMLALLMACLIIAFNIQHFQIWIFSLMSEVQKHLKLFGENIHLRFCSDRESCKEKRLWKSCRQIWPRINFTPIAISVFLHFEYFYPFFLSTFCVFSTFSISPLFVYFFTFCISRLFVYFFVSFWFLYFSMFCISPFLYFYTFYISPLLVFLYSWKSVLVNLASASTSHQSLSVFFVPRCFGK